MQAAAFSHRVASRQFVVKRNHVVRRLSSVNNRATPPPPLWSRRPRAVGASFLLAAGSLAILSSTPATMAVTSCNEEEEKAPPDSTSDMDELHLEWDDFYAKSVKPGEDDDDEEEDEEEEGEDEGTEQQEGEANEEEEEKTDETEEAKSDPPVVENEENEVEPSHAGSDNSEEAIEDDEYDNLPEKDEPTSCSICRINRQGPCRALWRKFEFCMKEKIGSSVGESASPGMAEKCDRYMMPWLTCFQEHRNFYTLATNSMYRFEYLDDAEASVPEEQKRPMNHPDVDWNGFLKFIEDGDLSLADFVVVKRALEIGSKKQTKLMAESMKDIGVDFKEEVLTFADVNDPKGLCDCQAKVSLKDPETLHPIEVAYARDQDGNILGFEMFTRAKKEGNEGEATMNFTVRFGSTEDVTFYAIYQPEAAQDGGSSNITAEKRLYRSEPISVFDPIRKAGLLGSDKSKPVLPQNMVAEKTD